MLVFRVESTLNDANLPKAIELRFFFAVPGSKSFFSLYIKTEQQQQQQQQQHHQQQQQQQQQQQPNFCWFVEWGTNFTNLGGFR